ncbi:TetR/AcrR family transcriptional regulator [Dongia sp.]|uniref:TetR/AcrR family transcriptional regulator n=1 Tax=Dongia sp. TaxID=1977262 RepID=UPI0035B2C363
MSKPTPRKRPYRQNRRAAQASLTRQRIVEAAIELHGAVGPARTTISMVAERADVQRHTLYAHFPTELSLYLACSGEALARDPLPDAQGWRTIEEPAARFRTGLQALYGWYRRNAGLTAAVLRDAECHPLTREIVAIRIAPGISAIQESLSEGLSAKQMPLLHLSLSFFTWRSLALESGLSDTAAIESLAGAIFGG